MERYSTAADIAILRRRILSSYDGIHDIGGVPLKSSVDLDSISPELDGTFIPHAERWRDFQNQMPLMPTNNASGSYLCFAVLGSA